MPLAVGRDPTDPTKWIWIDSATGQPASQPGGPGTPYIAQSDTPTAAPSGPTTAPTGPAAPGVGTTPKVPGQTGQTIQQVAASLGPGWTLKDPTAQPIEETAISNVPSSTPGLPSEKSAVGTGNYYVVVKGPDGQERALYLKPDASKDGKVAKVSGINDQSDADKGNLYSGDLRDLTWSQAKPVADVPNQPKQPTASAKLDKLDAKGNVITPGDTTSPTQLRDPATGTVIDLPKGDKPTLTTLGDQLLAVNPDGTYQVVANKPKDKSQFNVPGMGLVEYDPSKSGTDAYNVVIPTPKGATVASLGAQAIQKINGKTYVASDDGNGNITWTESNLPTEHTYTVAAGANDPRSSKITLIDENGNSTSVDKAGWSPPPSPQAGSAITPDTTSPFVVTIGDNGQPVFTKNQNALSISDAQKQLIQQLGGKVADGTMSEKAAQDLITNLTQAMTAQASATNAQANMVNAQANVAQNAIQGVNQAAQIGQGLLQNRVTAATGALNNAISAIGGSKMTSAPAGMGANLVNGLSEWVTQLGGGAPVYDAAAAMVNQANPTISGNPTVAQQAYTTLRGMMDLYKQQTGQDYQPPAVRQQQQQSFQSPTTLADGTPLSSVTPNAGQVANQNAAAQQLQQATTPTTTPFGAIGANPMLAAQQMYNRNLGSQQTAAATAQAGLPFGSQPLQPLPIPALPFQAPVTA